MNHRTCRSWLILLFCALVIYKTTPFLRAQDHTVTTSAQGDGDATIPLREFTGISSPPAGLLQQYIEDTELQDWLRSKFANNLAKATRKFTVRKFDLNGDGVPEYLVIGPDDPEWCGSGGCSGAIYRKAGAGYEAILGGKGGAALLFGGGGEIAFGARPTRSHEYFDLEQRKRDLRLVLAFDGKQYVHRSCYDRREVKSKTGELKDTWVQSAC